MTLLILLVSVAVLEYVMRHSEPMPRKGPFDEKRGRNAGQAQTGPPSLEESLGRLGQALEQFGSGSAPEHHKEAKPARATVKEP